MAIIKRKRGNVIYVYEKEYVKVKDGKRQYKEKVIGHLDETGNFIPSRKMRGKKPEDFPAEIQKVTTTTTKIRVVEKKESDSREKEKAEAIAPQANAPKPETAEADKTVTKKEKPKPATTSELGLYTADPLSIMFNGKATGTLGKLKTVGTFNEQQKTANVSGVKIISQNISEMGVGEAKIFRYALAAFTQKKFNWNRKTKTKFKNVPQFQRLCKGYKHGHQH